MVRCSFMPFLDYLLGSKSRDFEKKGCPVQGLRLSFLCNPWSWLKLHIVSNLLLLLIFLIG